MLSEPNKGLLIQEVGVNLDENSFIKLASVIQDEDGMEHYFGLIVLEPGKTTGGTRVAKIVSLVDLSEMIKWPLARPKIFLIGSPKEEWKEEVVPDHQNLPLAATSTVRTFGIPSEWLNVRGGSMKAIILTMSSTERLQTLFPPVGENDRTQTPNLDNSPILKQYILQNQVDAAIFRDDTGKRRSCGPIDQLIVHLKSPLMKPKYLVSPEKRDGEPPISLSRCKANDHAFNHDAFEPTLLSLCGENNCPNSHFNPAQSLPSFVEPVHVNIPDEGCGMSNEDEEMSEVSGEDLSSEKQQEELYRVANDDATNATCFSSRLVSSDQGDKLVALRKLDTQNLKLTQQSGAVSEEDLSETNYKMPQRFRSAMQHINLQMAHLFDTTELQDFSEWFQMIPNDTDPEAFHYNCAICSTRLKDYGIKESNKLSDKDGVLHRNQNANMKELRKHAKLQGHRNAMEFYHDELEAVKFQTLADMNTKRILKIHRNTIRNLKTAFTEAKEDTAFHKHKGLVNLQTSNSLRMGTQCTSEWTSKKMIVIMGEQIHEDFIASLIASDSPFGLICDGSTGKYLSKAEQRRPKANRAKRL